MHLVADDLGGEAILAILILPLSRTQTTLNQDGASFVEVVFGDLCRSIENYYAVPLNFRNNLSGLRVFVPSRGGYRKVCNRSIVLGVFDLWGGPKVT